MNLFSFLKNYNDNPENRSYGDILENKNSINNLQGYELEVYNYLKNNDKQRLINS